MLDNLVFSLNATMPISFVMVIGYFLKRIRFLDEHGTKTLDKIVFRVFLPALLFMDLAKQDFVSIWDTTFVLFCGGATIASIILAALTSLLDKDKNDRGEFIQASYRSAAATLGIAFMTNIYDNSAMLALMILISVPIYNIVAVIVLSLTSPENKGSNGSVLKKTVYNCITNPIILGILAGMVWSLLKLPKPVMFTKTMTYLGNVASPLALVSLGASFEFSNVKEKKGPLILVVFNKLFVYCLLFLPLAILLGFRNEMLVAVLIMLGSATTSASFIMARNMGHKGAITSSAVMVTTFLAAFSMTFWLFILRTFGFI